MKKLRLVNVSILRNFYQNRFINESIRKKNTYIPELNIEELMLLIKKIVEVK